MLMPPQQYQQPSQNPYDFILSGPPQKTGFTGGGSQKKRILVAAAIGGVLLLIFMLLFSLIFSGGKSNEETLLSIARQQSEIIRVADEGTKRARGPHAQNLAITTKLSVTTAQQDLVAYMGSHGVKVKAKQLAGSANVKTDAELTAAEQNNRFDEAFTAIIEQQLTAYRASLKQAYGETSNNTGRQLLSDSFKQVELLISKPPSQPAGAILSPSATS